MTEIEYYLDKARRGEADVAFHGLLELSGDPVPELREAFQVESDPVVREIIIRAVAPLAGPAVIQFLGAALDDPHPEVWKSALDGLVSIASPTSRQTLERAKDGTTNGDPERVAWLVEAIDQINETLVSRVTSDP
jgi:hypothetical protein